MADAVLFILIFAGFFVLRGIAATIIFYYLLPDGDRCPNCDAVTLRIESRGWNFLLPGIRSSWCYECDWHGMLRLGPVTPVAATREPSRTRIR
jgi:hypothetical protein